MLLGELRRWGLERRVVDELLPHADRALDWIVNYGDCDGDGFVEYARSTDLGLANQGWKDSFDGITFADGTIAEPPIALAEVQGYVYAAYLAKSHFCSERDDAEGAAYWGEKAEKLKEDFNKAFWMPEKGYFALGLDKDKRPIDSLASNMGHCLWTASSTPGKAAAVARNLTGPEMFSGFGIRTLGTNCGAYNPMSYHNGSIWPHDNAICAAGLMRYGFVREAQQVAVGILEAAEWFGGRLPELFCGFDRTEYSPSRSTTRPRAHRRPGPRPRRSTSYAPCCVLIRRHRTGCCGATRRCRPRSCRCTSSPCTWPAPGWRSTCGRTAGRSTASAKSWNWSGQDVTSYCY